MGKPYRKCRLRGPHSQGCEGQSCAGLDWPRRRGSLLVVALVALLVVSLLGTALVRSVLAHHRQLQAEQQRLQALWLAESAVGRAAVRLAGEPDYRGETWQVALPQDGQQQAGAAVIRVESLPDAPGRWKVTVEARYPDHPVHCRSHRKTVLLHLPESGDL